jgi:hypothetical protein
MIPRSVNFMYRRLRKFCFTFIGWVNKKNNLEQMARLFLQVKVWLKRILLQL